MVIEPELAELKLEVLLIESVGVGASVLVPDRDDEGVIVGVREMEADRESSRECEGDALSDVVVLAEVVPEGVVDGVTESDPDTDMLTVFVALLEALQLVVPSTVSLGDGSPVFDIVSDSDGVVDGDREDEVDRESSRECDTVALSDAVMLVVVVADGVVEGVAEWDPVVDVLTVFVALLEALQLVDPSPVSL